jgi:hypothetical protein
LVEKCLICGRDAISKILKKQEGIPEQIFELSNKLCEYHAMALGNLINKFEVWKLAYGELTWRSYMERVKGLEETGLWVKEVIKLVSLRDSGYNANKKGN